MKHTLRLLLISALLLILAACTNKPVTLQAQSRQEVHYQAPLQAESYRWTQLSGVEVALPEPESQTLRFIAPVVMQEEILLFELEAKSGENVQRLQVEVIVTPVASDTEDNTSTGGGTDDNSSTGGDSNSSTGGGSDDDNATGGSDDSNSTTVTLKALSLTLANTTLPKDHNTTVEVTATYTDNTTKEVTDQVTWIATPSDAIQINNAVLTARKDTTVTIQAKIGNTLSNKEALNIYWEVNGHRLPPEPDPAVNNSTLLGVDVNGNGVRDDVERWIYETYKEYIPCHQELDWNNTVVIDGKTIPSGVQVCEDKPVSYHPVVRAVAMQGARAAQIIIQEPEKARETTKLMDDAQDCEFYLNRISKEYKKGNINLEDVFSKEFKKIQFNTVMRARAFAQYNFNLSGGIYGVPATAEEELKGCNEEVKELLKDLK